MRFRAVPLQPRGDKLLRFGAYYLDPLSQAGPHVTLKEKDAQDQDSALSDMQESAAHAAAFLKALAHEGRLMILCHLGEGEKSVGELENLLNIRQAAVSQMLARLRGEGLVSTRREGKTIYYSLQDGNTAQMIGLLYDLFCKPQD